VAERVQLIGVALDGGGLLMVPVRQPDGTWVVLGYDSIGYHDSLDEVRDFAQRMEDDGGVPEDEVALYRLLADVMDGVQRDGADDGS
jgi:hypothetical protein